MGRNNSKIIELAKGFNNFYFSEFSFLVVMEFFDYIFFKCINIYFYNFYN